jgi:hypothetical protein
MPNPADFTDLIGKPAWGLSRTTGSMFFLEIGKSHEREISIKKREKLKVSNGDWHFLIEMSSWRFESRNEVIIGSNDEPTIIDGCFERLDLGTIENISVSTPANDLHILFSSDIAFESFRDVGRTKDWSLWTLFCPNETYWSADAVGSLKNGSIHEPRQ